jgi:hypothetical protein
MASPIKIVFDGDNNVDGSDTLHMPKLSQGAPYSFGFRLRTSTDPDVYREWDSIPENRWRIKLAPADKHELMTLLLSEGNFEIDSVTDTLMFKLSAADWEGVELPQSSNFLEMDVPFAFVVEFLDGAGAVTERFAQGSGFITVSLDF